MDNFGILMEIKGIEDPFKWSRDVVERLQGGKECLDGCGEIGVFMFGLYKGICISVWGGILGPRRIGLRRSGE